MKVTPLADRVLVKRVDSETKTKGGLYIPDTAKEKPQQGEVLAVGPGKRAESTGEVIPVGIEVGQTVLYSKYGGTEVKVDGEEYLIMREDDILGIIE